MGLLERILGRSKIFPLFNLKKSFQSGLKSLFSSLDEEDKEPVKFSSKKTKDDVSKKFGSMKKVVSGKKYHKRILSAGGSMVKAAQKNIEEQHLVIWNADTPNNPEATCDYCWSLHGQVFQEEEAPYPAHDSCDCELDKV